MDGGAPGGFSCHGHREDRCARSVIRHCTNLRAAAPAGSSGMWNSNRISATSPGVASASPDAGRGGGSSADASTAHATSTKTRPGAQKRPIAQPTTNGRTNRTTP